MANQQEEIEACRKELKKLRGYVRWLDRKSDDLVKRIGRMEADDKTSDLYGDAVEFHLEVSGWNATMKRGEAAEGD